MIDEREKANIGNFQAGVSSASGFSPTAKKMMDQDTRYQAGIALAIEKMKLRQWAAEQGIRLACTAQNPINGKDILSVMNAIFNFVTQQENTDDKTA